MGVPDGRRGAIYVLSGWTEGHSTLRNTLSDIDLLLISPSRCLKKGIERETHYFLCSEKGTCRPVAATATMYQNLSSYSHYYSLCPSCPWYLTIIHPLAIPPTNGDSIACSSTMRRRSSNLPSAMPRPALPALLGRRCTWHPIAKRHTIDSRRSRPRAGTSLCGLCL
ncbi:hypothetical protein BDZ85DRAFT_70211 [Elsinoe ampelina]|uniref:Uncharacterized protein n=1 Tax=Elsinoe ampelina TaxID=302913 RepID=A0A6A6GIY9_9PEZI|nr:hypothetical protein BDZ85DRAFT_70211 [Elsinoe ampelina]